MSTRVVRSLIGLALAVGLSSPVLANGGEEQSQSQPPDHEHMQMNMAPTGWQFMQDGVVFGVFNHQGGPRGGDEFKVTNWWMGMATRQFGSSQLTVTSMFSLEPATVGKRGYGEIMQIGETVGGRPLIDRQHPHDLFMQLAAIWRRPITSTTGFTIAAGPAGEPALGPVAFMHRVSAAENAFAPLSHHTFDSTHVAYGVITAAVNHGPWVIEGSLFNAREPDERRWDFDFGALDSVSARVWYRPTERFELQLSSGHLRDPEELEPGNIQRTTTSASWFKRSGADFTAVTIGYGLNATHEANRQAVFGEATRHVGLNSLFGRVEVLQVETDLLLTGAIPVTAGAAARKDTIGAFTIGGVRDIVKARGFEGGLGAALTFYAVPERLKITHGEHPVSFQVFFRLRPPAGSTGRMWNMRMSQPMVEHSMQMTHEMK